MKRRRSIEAKARIANIKRLLACLASSFVLTLMIKTQEDTQSDFGFTFRETILGPRILIFLRIRITLQTAITFGPRAVPYLTRPKLRPLTAKAMTIIVSLTLLKQTDSTSIETRKFRPLAATAADTESLDPITRVFFGSILPNTAWLLLILMTILTTVAMLQHSPGLGYVTNGLALLFKIQTQYSQSAINSYLNTPNHATSSTITMLNFLTITITTLVSARSSSEMANAERFVDTVMTQRPGMPLIILNAMIGLIKIFFATWFSPTDRNATLATTSQMFQNEGLGDFSSAYLSWLDYVLFFTTLASATAASYLHHRVLGYVNIALNTVSILITLWIVRDFSGLATSQNFNNAKNA